jgi:hypothetical protein
VVVAFALHVTTVESQLPATERQSRTRPSINPSAKASWDRGAAPDLRHWLANRCPALVALLAPG